MNKRITVLLVEGDQGDAEFLKEMISGSDISEFEVEHVMTLQAAGVKLEEKRFHIVLLDLGLPDGQGRASLEAILRFASGTPVVVISDLEDEGLGQELGKMGAQDYLIKDQVDPRLLGRSLCYAIERVTAKRIVLQERNRAQNYLDIAGAMMVAIDDREKVTLINRKGCELLGYPEEDILGRNWFVNFLPASVREEVRGAFLKIMSGKISSTRYFENPVLTSSGEERLIAWQSSLIKGEDGAIQGSLSSGTDITEARKAEADLGKAREEWKDIFQAIGHPAFILDPDQTILAANQATALVVGAPVEDIVGKKCYEIFHKAKKYPEDCPLKDLLKSGSAETREILTEALNGTFLVSCTPVLDNDGKLEKIIHIATDITQRKKVELGLRTSEERYRTTVDSLSSGVHIIDRDYNILLMNKIFREWTKRLGLEEAMVGNNLFDVYSFLSEKIREEYQQVFETREMLITEERTVLGGEEIFTETRKIPILEDGGIVRVVTVIHDVSEKKRGELELRNAYLELKKSKQFVDTLLNTSPDTIYIYDLIEKRNIFVNREVVQGLGYSEKELQKMDSSFISKLMHPDDLAVYLEKTVPRYLELEDGELLDHQYRMKKRSGEWCWLRARELIFTRLEDGKPQRIFGVVHDITEERKAQIDLEESEEKFRNIVEASPMGIHMYQLEADDRLVFIGSNAPAETILHIDHTLLLGKSIEEAFPSLKGTEVPSRYREAARDGKRWQTEQIIYEDKRVEGAFEVHAFQTSPGKMVAMFRDITERKKREEELKEANHLLKVASRQKSELVGAVSHDFGNPLSVIQTSAELMLQGIYGEPTPRMKDRLHSIFNATRRLDRLRRDTLDVTRMDRGEMSLNRKTEDLSQLVRSAVIGVRGKAEEKNQSVNFTCKTPVVLSFDPFHILRVLENYLGNAVRYTPEKGVIEVDISESEDEVKVCVRDSGRGIPPEELENIFQPFYRVGAKVKGSTGLGLTIVKGIVEAHKGRCWAQSQGKGKGSCFCFTLPREARSQDTVPGQ